VIFGEGNVESECRLNDERVEIVYEFVYLARCLKNQGVWMERLIEEYVQTGK
jgi:hypothetical protein